MSPAWLLIVLTFMPGQSPVAKDDQAAQQAARAKRERLLEIYVNEAAGYAIFRDSSRKERVALRREPVYVWTNPVRGGEQDGAVYVWTCRGRAEVLGTFFSYPATGPRHLSHEFHSLSLSVLDVERQGTHPSTWTPLAPGIEIAPIPRAPVPDRSAPQRLVPDARRSLTSSPPRPRTKPRVAGIFACCLTPSTAMRAPIPMWSTAPCSHS